MAETITKKLYNDEIEIVFYPNSHKYKIAGERTYLQSVTSITGLLDKSRALIPWAVNTDFEYLLDNIQNEMPLNILTDLIEEARRQHEIKRDTAADIGTQIHEFAELFTKYKLGLNECPEIKEDMQEEVKNGIGAFLNFYNENNIEFKESEKFCYSKKYKFVGTTDSILKIDGKLFVVDYKSSNGIYDEAKLQVSAYGGAYEEETGNKIDGGLIVRFGKNDGELETFKISKSDMKKNYKAFLGLLTVKNRLKELSNEK